MLKKLFSALLIILIILGIGFYYYLSKTHPTTSPAITGMYYLESITQPHAKLDKHVLGFLPYWRLDDIQHIRPNLLSEINYFSLTVGNDGKLAKVVNGETDPGWRSWESEKVKNLMTRAKIMGTDVTVTVAALDNQLIVDVLDSDTAQDNLIADIVAEVKDKNLQGINIDFEYFGEPDAYYRESFTAFSKKLRTAIDKEAPATALSLSIMPLSARENDLFDFPKLVPLYDRFIGMSYDYYGAGSDIAGPVAPMKGFKEGKYFFDVETTYEDYRQYIPAEKLVMGVPYYGWERAVEDGKTINGLTFPSASEDNYAAVISYARARESQDIKKNQCKWDDVAQETWCWFKDANSGTDRQVWIADNRSVGIRFDYANKQNLGGIAIWTLGYDKQYADLWDMISNKFTHQ